MEPPCPTRRRRRWPHHSRTLRLRIASAVGNQSAGAVSGTERLHGANQVAIIAKAARLVLHCVRWRGSFRVADGDRMRAVRLTIALLIMSPIFIVAIDESSRTPRLLAQVTALPGPAPLTAPVAPGQPRAFSTIGALPALVPAPGTRLAAAPSALPTPRVFRCTCSSPGNWTEWAGSVPSSSYILARQSARGQCANYLQNANPPSAYIPQTSAGLTSQRPTIYNGTAFTQRAQVSTSVGQTVLQQRSRVSQLTGQCSQCACN